MKQRFFIQTTDIDVSQLNRYQRYLVIIHAFLCRHMMNALNTFFNAVKNNNPELPNAFFSENEGNALFNELTYSPDIPWTQKLFLFHKRAIKMVCVDTIVIVIARIRQELLSESVLEKTIRSLEGCVKLLKADNRLLFVNQRGYRVPLSNFLKHKFHLIILYDGEMNDASPYNNQRYFKTKHTDAVHFMSRNAYHKIIATLVTPREACHYFSFREWLCKKKSHLLEGISETSLLGQYLIDEKDEVTANKYAVYVDNLKIEHEKWSVILGSLYHHTLGTSKQLAKDYYTVLVTIAKLSFDEALLLQNKFFIAYENVTIGRMKGTYDCDIAPFGFVFIQCNDPNSDQSAILQRYTILLQSYRYQHQWISCVGIVFFLEKTSRKTNRCRIVWHVNQADSQPIDE